MRKSLKKKKRREGLIFLQSQIPLVGSVITKNGILGLENRPRGRPKTMSNYKRKKKKTGKPLTRRKNCWKDLLFEAENAILKKLDPKFRKGKIQSHRRVKAGL